MSPARCLVLVLLLAAGGCASRGPLVSTAPVELEATPFFPQQDLQCGPAALAAVLGAAGVPTQPEQLVREVYTPGLEGSLQLELAAAARARGLLPVEVAPELDALLAELAAGRPVLVLQNLGLRSLPAWHYAVVIGADPATDELILRSGVERRAVTPAAKFLRSWDLAGRWGLVLLAPGELPAMPDRDRYFAAVAGLEASGRHAAASRAWAAALEAWPDDPVALFGFATANHLAGNLAAAYDGYVELLRRAPDHAAALNNLAHLLADHGCPVAARTLAQRALDTAAPGGAIAAAAQDTLAGLSGRAGEERGCRLP